MLRFKCQFYYILEFHYFCYKKSNPTNLRVLKKQIFFFIILFTSCIYGYAQTTLNPGDIAITGFNCDDTGGFINIENEFTFVLLKDIENGTAIRFTDNGWLSSGGFRANEGIIEWEANSDLSCGIEINISTGIVDFGFFSFPFYLASTGSVDASNFANFDLSTSGDQILAYQGTDASPSFVFAINFNGGNWRGGGAVNNQTSALPSGLSDGINEVSVRERDNGNYDCTVIQGTPLILEAICIRNNWYTNDTRFSTLGGCSYRCGPCGSTIIWNGTWSGTPNLTTEVIFEADYSTSSGSVQACSVTVDSGATLTISNNSYIEVENDVVINGTLIVESQGNFVQKGEGTDAGTFTGNVTLNKTTALKGDWFYYTYWSSPVVNETISNVFPLVETNWRYSFNAANFVDNNGDDVDDDVPYDWEIATGGTTMTPGVGYAISGEKVNAGSYPRSDDISFTGIFNTGDISVPITFAALNTGIKWNFIGNPYPSAIDFDAFYNANSSVIEGVAYFWSHASPADANNPGNDDSNFSQDDYAVYNAGSGGVATKPGGSGVIPNGYVASAQGFFIPAITSGTVTFTNAMRVPDNASNNQFFKASSSKKSSTSPSSPLENKLWINLTSDNGVFNQILVAYVDNATDAYDGMSYDAPKILNLGYVAALYSNIDSDDTKYIIQGKAINSIDENEVIKIGLSSTIDVATIYTLSVDHFEGEFLNSNTIYLKDNLLSTIHDLTDSDYSFTSEAGEFNDRFEIVFKAEALSIDKNNLDNNLLSIVNLNNDEIQFKTSENLTIKTVAIFDLLGRQLYELKGNTNSETYRLSNLSKTAYIIKVRLSNGAVVTEKMMKN